MGKGLRFPSYPQLGGLSFASLFSVATEWSPGDVEERQLVGKTNRP